MHESLYIFDSPGNIVTVLTDIPGIFVACIVAAACSANAAHDAQSDSQENCSGGKSDGGRYVDVSLGACN